MSKISFKENICAFPCNFEKLDEKYHSCFRHKLVVFYSHIYEVGVSKTSPTQSRVGEELCFQIITTIKTNERHFQKSSEPHSNSQWSLRCEGHIFGGESNAHAHKIVCCRARAEQRQELFANSKKPTSTSITMDANAPATQSNHENSPM